MEPTLKQLRRFKARRTWGKLAIKYGVSKVTMHKCIRENRRPTVLTPDEWEDILVYRAEWHKAHKMEKERGL